MRVPQNGKSPALTNGDNAILVCHLRGHRHQMRMILRCSGQKGQNRLIETGRLTGEELGSKRHRPREGCLGGNFAHASPAEAGRGRSNPT